MRKPLIVLVLVAVALPAYGVLLSDYLPPEDPHPNISGLLSWWWVLGLLIIASSVLYGIIKGSARDTGTSPKLVIAENRRDSWIASTTCGTLFGIPAVVIFIKMLTALLGAPHIRVNYLFAGEHDLSQFGADLVSLMVLGALTVIPPVKVRFRRPKEPTVASS